MAIRKLLNSTDFKTELANDKLGILFDVRMEEEFDEDRICDSINCDYEKAEDFLECLLTFDKSKHYYLYCMTGRRSEYACDLMEKMGFEYLIDLEGGMLRFDGKLCE